MQDSLFRSLFVAYPDALILADMAGQIVLANPIAHQLLGYGPGELEGQSIEALVPDSIRPRHAAYREAYGKAPRARPMGTQMDLVARRKDGSEVMVEIALSPLQDQGLPYVVAAIRNIAEYPRVKEALKRARYAEHVAQIGRLAVNAREPEALLRQVPLSAAEALEVEAAVLFLLEPDGQNFRVAGGTGLVEGEALGARVPNRPDTPPGFVAAQGAPVTVDDYRSEQRFSPPASYLQRGLVSALAVPLIDRDKPIGALTVRSRQPQRFGGDETRFLLSLANIVITTLQRTQSEDALRHAQRLESVGQLTGGIAHDFNNLLTVIHGNLQVLEDLPGVGDNESAQQMIAAAERAAQRGAELTGKLLAFSRRQVLQPTQIDLRALLGSLADMLRRTLDQRIVIGVDLDADCPPCLADPGQLESALLNIAINARDAMPEGGHLTFSARPAAVLPPELRDARGGDGALLAPADYVAIAITDTGSGMPDSVKARAFEPFFTTKEAGRGTGLGLATVYGFAVQSKGTVTIDSSPGQGTTVTLFIPKVRSVAAGSARGKARGSQLPPGLKVLAVEDEPEVLRVVQAFLAGWGCEVTACSSAEQALAVLQAGDTPFDLLLSDVVLGPGMRGTELGRRAKALHPALPVLLMSGYSSELLAAEREALAGTPELLRKPFTRSELSAAILGVIAPSRPTDG
jgi:PAS domain S-box-containing protein